MPSSTNYISTHQGDEDATKNSLASSNTYSRASRHSMSTKCHELDLLSQTPVAQLRTQALYKVLTARGFLNQVLLYALSLNHRLQYPKHILARCYPLGHGFGVYRPEGRYSRPQEPLQGKNALFGDVGQMNDNGTFQFNVFFPSNHPIQNEDLRENFQPISPSRPVNDCQ